jgi:hypothetical protein
MKNIIPDDSIDKIKAELTELDNSLVEIDGRKLKPSNCYYFEANPAHILYNTNCPQILKEKIDRIILKYVPDESSAR